jgi:hypothetical protein
VLGEKIEVLGAEQPGGGPSDLVAGERGTAGEEGHLIRPLSLVLCPLSFRFTVAGTALQFPNGGHEAEIKGQMTNDKGQKQKGSGVIGHEAGHAAVCGLGRSEFRLRKR